jgi:hypothetical protein
MDDHKLSAAERAHLDRIETYWAVLLEGRKTTPEYREALMRITEEVHTYLAHPHPRRSSCEPRADRSGDTPADACPLNGHVGTCSAIEKAIADRVQKRSAPSIFFASIESGAHKDNRCDDLASRLAGQSG